MRSSNTTFLALTCFFILCNGIYEVCGGGGDTSTSGVKRGYSAVQGSTVRNIPEEYTVDMCIEFLKTILGGTEDIIKIIRLLLYNACPSTAYDKDDIIGRCKSTDLTSYIDHIVTTIDNAENTPEYKIKKKHRTHIMKILRKRGSGTNKLGVIRGLMFSSKNHLDDTIIKSCIDDIFNDLSNSNIVQSIMSIRAYCGQEISHKPYMCHKILLKTDDGNSSSGTGSGSGIGYYGTGGLNVDLND